MNFDSLEFIAWDCEGMNAGMIDRWTERQNLVLMSASTGDYLYDERGILQSERLEFIHSIAQQFPSSHYKHVFFGGSYDFNKILEGLSLRKVEQLHRGKHWTIHNGEWAI